MNLLLKNAKSSRSGFVIWETGSAGCIQVSAQRIVAKTLNLFNIPAPNFKVKVKIPKTLIKLGVYEIYPPIWSMFPNESWSPVIKVLPWI